jgi:hypothetical protein
MRIPAKPVRKEVENRETVPHCALDACSLRRVSKAIVMIPQWLRPKNRDLNSRFLFLMGELRGETKSNYHGLEVSPPERQGVGDG